MALPDLKDRFVGALLGTMAGDQLGSCFEGKSRHGICGEDAVVDALVDVESARRWIRRGTYTDDTQMMVGVAESLTACGGFDGRHMAGRFAANYEPHRGYAGGARAALEALRAGQPWDRVATLVFPDGSFGNGAAMRVAPVGALHHHDPHALREVAEASAAITHAHPLGMEGAVVQAFAVAQAMQSHADSFDPRAFVRSIGAYVRPDAEAFVDRLCRLGELLGTDATPDEVIRRLGNDVRAHASVPAAIYAFAAHPGSFAEAVIYAVSLGGDTDTIGAMAGAIAGAFHGAAGIPASWLDGLDAGDGYRDHVMGLAERLHGLSGNLS